MEEEKVCEEKDKAFKDAAVKLKKDKEPGVTEKDLKDVAFIETNEKINQDYKKEEAAKKATPGGSFPEYLVLFPRRHPPSPRSRGTKFTRAAPVRSRLGRKSLRILTVPRISRPETRSTSLKLSRCTSSGSSDGIDPTKDFVKKKKPSNTFVAAAKLSAGDVKLN